MHRKAISSLVRTVRSESLVSFEGRAIRHLEPGLESRRDVECNRQRLHSEPGGLDPRDLKTALSCGSFLRKGEVLANVRLIHNLKDLKATPHRGGNNNLPVLVQALEIDVVPQALDRDRRLHPHTQPSHLEK